MFSDTLKVTNYPFNKVDIGLINNDSLAQMHIQLFTFYMIQKQ